MAPKAIARKQKTFVSKHIRDFLRAHKGQAFSDAELAAELGKQGHELDAGRLGSFRTYVAANYPEEFSVVGSRGHWSYCAGAQSATTKSLDMLIVCRYGDKQSVEFKIEHAREIFEQLAQLFNAR